MAAGHEAQRSADERRRPEGPRRASHAVQRRPDASGWLGLTRRTAGMRGSASPTGAGHPGRGARRPFGVYVHVPFCAARCGYCDFNTYTPSSWPGPARRRTAWLDGGAPRAGRWPRASVGAPAGRHGVRRRRHAVAARGRRGSAQVLDAVRATFGLAPGAEVTTESNPESTSPEFFARLVDGRVHAGVAGDAVGRAARAAGAGPPAHARPGRRRGAGGPGGRARARQPRPDLRDAGGDRRRPARPRSTRCSTRGWTTSRRTR